MKPDWDRAPEGFDWLAMDGDGYWYWWFEKPEWDEKRKHWFRENDVDVVFATEKDVFSDSAYEPVASETLEHRPEPTK